jgi:hypothetical protein
MEVVPKRQTQKTAMALPPPQLMIITQQTQAQKQTLGALMMRMKDEVGDLIGSSANTDEEKLKQMRSMYVEDKNGNLIHKRTLLNSINRGRALTKSFDRTKRVRGDARHGNGNGCADSCVKKAFQICS